MQESDRRVPHMLDAKPGEEPRKPYRATVKNQNPIP